MGPIGKLRFSYDYVWMYTTGLSDRAIIQWEVSFFTDLLPEIIPDDPPESEDLVTEMRQARERTDEFLDPTVDVPLSTLHDQAPPPKVASYFLCSSSIYT
jgi:hypothetical protein